ncbi:MAG TPA: hypothetical protein VJ729_14175 [Nitrososphaeraceae archaeon]|jgi:hypothetical protein|nr:hypothetical protein [Nitrososphaeraceae archaeon]
MNYSKQNQNQKDYYIQIRNSGIRITLLATVGILVVFALYGYRISQLNSDNVVSFNITKSLSNLGFIVILFLIGSLITIVYGVYRICLSQKMKIRSNAGTKRGVILLILPLIIDIISQRKSYQIVFISILFAYALLFAFVSQIVIFRPGISFSKIYEVAIPSWIITPCCNFPGLVPTFTAYLADDLIIFITPLNLILTVILSTLVSVNITLALCMFQNNKSKNTANKSCFSGFGIAMGLFTACPTCAGTFFSTITGLISASTYSALATASATSAFAPFQILFIVISISVLLVSPYLSIKGMINKN